MIAATTPAKTVIDVRDLSKSYRTFRGARVHALQGVSLRVQAGSIYGLIGKNGAGKTTLIKILLGLCMPSGGSAKLLGGDPLDPAIRRRVGYLPEQSNLPDYFKARNLLRYMGLLNRVNPETLDRRIPELIEMVGLAGVDKTIKAYSKGMRQRLGIAQALINDPELVFLDEPTDGLDPMGRKEVRDLLLKLKASGKTVFVNSHLLSEIEMICDQIVILDRGNIAHSASPVDVQRGTGEYRVRVATVDPAIRGIVDQEIEDTIWEQTTVRFKACDRTRLNRLIDRLRGIPVEIESIEPVKLSLEQFFFDVVGEKES